MNDHFNAVRCHTLYVKISQIINVNVSCLKKKNELKAYGAVEEMSDFCDRDSRQSETQTNALLPFFHSPPPLPPCSV